MEFLRLLFDTSQYPARWHCGVWTDFWGWLHITSDLFIFLAYMCIPITILFFRKRLNQFQIGKILLLFAAFITLCGITHLNEAIIFWYPFYNFQAVTKLFTAIISVGTVFAIILLLPEILKLVTEKRTSLNMRTIIDSCPQGILIVNKKGTIVFANKNILEIFGFELHELLQKNIESMMPDSFRSKHTSLREDYLKHPEQRQMGVGRDLFALRKNGEHFPVEIGLNPIRFEGEDAVLCSIVDITERKNKENELNQLNLSLERSNAELEEFTYIASHDLKEPLRGIHNYSIMLSEKYEALLDDNGKDKLHKLPKLTKRLEEQIDCLLEYSRLGKNELKFEKINLNHLILESIEMLAHLINERKVKITIQENIPEIVGNSIRLTEVFNNLMTNAIKYNLTESPTIEIGYQIDNEKASKDMCVVYVKDNGIGIPKEHLGKVFTIFKRLHPRDQFGGGSGVGLTIVKKIIAKHGGDIWVESVPGKGTTLFFTLKRYLSENQLHPERSTGT